MFFVYVPTWSMSPVIVTFGAGACAMAGGARTPSMATRATARINSLLITASLKESELQQRTAVVPPRPTATTEADCGQREGYTGYRAATSSKNYISSYRTNFPPPGLGVAPGRPGRRVIRGRAGGP